MNCYNHPSHTSVATCIDCGKGLCTECAHKYEIPICLVCNNYRISNERKHIKKEFILIIAVGFIFFLLCSGAKTSFPARLFSFYLGASLVAGWRFFNRITPQLFLFLPLIGWLTYFIIKTSIAGFVGILYLPYRVFLNIKRLKELNQIPS